MKKLLKDCLVYLMIPSFVFTNILFIPVTTYAGSPIWGVSPISEPYPYVSSGSFSGPAVPESPDPLVSYRWPNPQATDGLEIYLLKPQTVTTDTPSSFGNLNSLTGDTPNVTVNGTGSIMLNFGTQSAAWLEFDSPDCPGGIEMSNSPYTEACVVNAGAQQRIKRAAPVKYQNTYRLELNSELYEGVRYGWIHITSFSVPWHITGIRLVCQVKPTNYNGSFSCSDSSLTKIWYLNAYTMKANYNKDYFGAILTERSDRTAWAQTSISDVGESLVAFANYDFIKKDLDYTKGMDNGIANSYPYWIQAVCDYYRYTGDSGTFGSYLDFICSRLEIMYNQYGGYPSNPPIGFYGHDERQGACFENPNCQENLYSYWMDCIRAWREFAWAAGQYGRSDLRDKYNGYADEKVAGLRSNPNWYNNFGIHACSYAIDAGFTNQAERDAIYQLRYTDRLNNPSHNPFSTWFMVDAMGRANKYDTALQTVRDYWGGEIANGATMNYEGFRPCWNDFLAPNEAIPNGTGGYTSENHPWGGVILKWMNEELLGIKPTAPGFNTYDIIPHLGRTLSWVSGKTPTPKGDITASFNIATGTCIVTSPAGTTARIGIPKAEKSINSINVNGQLAWDGTYHPVTGISGANQDPVYVYFTGAQPGTYNISVSYSGTTPAYTEPPIIYPAEFVKEDLTTSGNWGGVYGKDGYILCNYTGVNADIKQLPSYVSQVNYGSNYNCQWTSNTNDSRAPAPDSWNGFPRKVGCLYSGCPAACRQTFTVDITVNDTRDYQVALYFVDWDNAGRRLAVEMFDTNTNNLIAPVKAVKNFYGGKYLVYKYHKSVRFRICQTREPNAVLSGIFFDSSGTDLLVDVDNDHSSCSFTGSWERYTGSQPEPMYKDSLHFAPAGDGS